jgi:predicted ferric reductase
MSTPGKDAGLKRLLVPTVCAVTLLIPVVVWLISTHRPLEYFTHLVPPGQRLYILSKLCGLLALAAFWFQCMTALARSAPAVRGFFSLTRRQHVMLGTATFVLVVAHLGLFIAASSIRTHHLTLPLLIPTFDQGFYTAFVSVGAIAFWILVAVIIAGILRARGYRIWRWLHRASLVVFALGFLHGITIGSETRFGLMKYIYAFIGLSLAAAVGSWIWLSVGVRWRARGRDPQSAVVTVASAAGSK